MKKGIAIGILIGIIIGGSITGVIAYQYSANQVSYTPKDGSWNVSNVKDAIDSLKNGYKTSMNLIGSGKTSTMPVEIQTKTFDVTAYDGYQNFTEDNFYVVIKGVAPADADVGTITYDVSYIEKNYNPNTGILTVKTPNNALRNVGVWIYYDVYLNS